MKKAERQHQPFTWDRLRGFELLKDLKRQCAVTGLILGTATVRCVFCPLFLIPESNPAAWISRHASVILSSKDAALQGFYCEGQIVEKIKKQHQTKQKPFKLVKKLSHRNSSCQSLTHFMPQMWHLEPDSNLLRIRIANCGFLSNSCLLF